MTSEQKDKPKTQHMIELKAVSKVYDENITALQSVSLTIAPGELVSVVGRSGAGKSTVVRLLLAEERVSKGTITVGGWDITNVPRRDVPQLRRQIGTVFQDFKLLPKKTIFENVAFALEVSGEPVKLIREIVPQVLNLVGLSNRMHQYPEQLSGGEQQRASIARALIHRPKLLLADEPTGNLDSINTSEIIDLLKKINDLGTTIVLVTHNRDVVNTLRRRVITLDKGAIVSDQAVGRYVL